MTYRSTPRPRRTPLRWLLGFVVLTGSLLAGSLTAPSARAQDATWGCPEALESSETLYVEGRYDEVIQVVSSCLRTGTPTAEMAVAAYRLMALSYIKRGEIEEAKLAILQLFGRDATYQPDPIRDLPAYTSLVNLVRQQVELRAEPEPTERREPERSARTRSNRRWLVASGAILLGGVVTALTLGDGGTVGGGGGSDMLPLPPGVPQ